MLLLGKKHMEGASLPQLTLHPDRSPMQLHNAFTDGESKSKSIDLSYQARVRPIKTIKNVLQMLWGNTTPLIFYPDLHQWNATMVGEWQGHHGWLHLL